MAWSTHWASERTAGIAAADELVDLAYLMASRRRPEQPAWMPDPPPLPISLDASSPPFAPQTQDAGHLMNESLRMLDDERGRVAQVSHEAALANERAAVARQAMQDESRQLESMLLEERSRVEQISYEAALENEEAAGRAHRLEQECGQLRETSLELGGMLKGERRKAKGLARKNALAKEKQKELVHQNALAKERAEAAQLESLLEEQKLHGEKLAREKHQVRASKM